MLDYKALTDGEVATLEARANLLAQVGDRDRDGLALLARKLSDFDADEAREFCAAAAMLGNAVERGCGCVYLGHGSGRLVQPLAGSQPEALEEPFEAESGERLWRLAVELTMGGAAQCEAATEAATKGAAVNPVCGKAAAKTVRPDEDCVLPGCDRYGGNDTYLRIRKVLGNKGAFDFCMGNVIKLVDRWEKKGDPVQNLEKLRDYSAQALVEWRLWTERLS